MHLINKIFTHMHIRVPKNSVVLAYNTYYHIITFKNAFFVIVDYTENIFCGG